MQEGACVDTKHPALEKLDDLEVNDVENETEGITMKKLVAMMVLSVIWTAAAFAAEVQYEVGVDGLACPFCAYGIEKKLSSIDDVQEIAVDITKGVVIVTMADRRGLQRGAPTAGTQLPNPSEFETNHAR